MAGSGDELTELLTLAVDIATRAGRLLVEGRPEAVEVSATKSSPTDIVTEMDRSSERLIVGALADARPDDGVLGEEGSRGRSRSGVRWIIDPIDGTVNYLYGLAPWAVSIAAERDDRTLLGVVHVPPSGETFTAARGRGAQRNGAAIRVNTAVPLERALVATGFGYVAARRARQAEVLRAVLPRVRDVRRGGSAAVDLCSLGCGRVDAYYERGVQTWDVAAGGLVAAEAGARVAGLRGRPASEEFTLAAAPELFGQLHDLLAGLNADRD